MNELEHTHALLKYRPNRKIELIEAMNPEWRDLYEALDE